MKNFRQKIVSSFVLTFVSLTLSISTVAQESIDIQALWAQLQNPTFERGQIAAVEGIVIKRDVATLTLIGGQLALAQPVVAHLGEEGRAFAAAFKGRGRLHFAPSLPMEKQQLKFHSKQEVLETEFTEAVFLFTDATSEELTGQLTFKTGDPASLQKLYANRNKRWTKYGLNWEPRLLKSLFSSHPGRYDLFVAELKTKGHGWLTLIVDAADPEQVELVRFDSGRRARDIWAKFPVGNTRPQDAFADPLAHHDYRITQYALDVTVEGNTNLIGRADVSLDLKREGERVLLFLLDPNLRVTEVATEKGQTLGFFQPVDPKDDFFLGDYLAVISPDPFSPGPVLLHFRYSGKRLIRKVGDGNFFCQSFGWYPTYSLGRYSITINEFVGKSDFQIYLRVPKRYDAVVVGTKVGEEMDGDYKLTQWQSDIPLRVAGFAYGDYKIVTEKSGETEIQVYANKQPDDFMRSIEVSAGGSLPTLDGNRLAGSTLGSLSPSGMAKTMLTEIGNSLRVMEDYFGPYPYKKLAVSNIPFSFGQGWPSLLYLSQLSFLDSSQRHQLGIKDHVRLTHFFRAHETSHQWWGHVVGWKSYHDQWLSEGFAEFSGNLYTLFRKDPKEYVRLLKKSRVNLLSKDRKGAVYDQIGPIYAGRRLSSKDHRGGYSVIVYEKGGWVLHMLRMMLFEPRNPNDPDARFKVMMKDFTKTYFNQAASTEDFKAIVEKHMLPSMDVDRNGTMDWFFDSWVYGTGIPKYEFKYTITPGPQSGQYLLKGMLKQTNVRDDFKMVVPLYFHQGRGSVRGGWLTARGPETPFETVLGFKPDKVTINDLEEVLAVVKQ